MRYRYSWLILALAIGLVVSIRPTSADNATSPQTKDKDKEKDKEKDKGVPLDVELAKPQLVKVEKGPLTVAITAKGMVMSEEATELSVKLNAWAGQLVAKKAVEHGSPVKTGDVLVEFESEKLDQAIRDARWERDLSKLAIRLAELELPILEKQIPLDLAVAEREHKEAAEDMRLWAEVDRKLTLGMSEDMVKIANFRAESAKDELKQLQKMYRDKDLTEETETIILKRYKFLLEYAETYSAIAKIMHEKTGKVEVPRREQALKTAVDKAELSLAKARDVQPLTLKQKRLNLEHLEFEERKSAERLAELEKDRAALIVKAPVDGLAYYGRFVGGQWMIPAGAQGPALSGVGQINPGDVFLTIVSPTKLLVRAEVEEKDLAGLKPGLMGTLSATAYLSKKTPCELLRVAKAPHEGKFELRIKITGDIDDLVPGMTGSVRFVTAKKKAALTVPTTAVFEDAAEDTHYVYIPLKDGKHEKKTVKVGVASGDRAEILSGLKDGEEILSSKP